MVEDFSVGGVAERYRIELVHLHELVENIGTEHHRAGDGYGDSVEVIAHRILLDDGVDECQAAAFASQ